jgi:Ca2+/Na+ antiporter
MIKHNELTIIAGIFTITAFLLFVYRVHITKVTDHLTYLWIGLVLMAQITLFIYGKINHIFGIYVPAFILFSGIVYILYIKISYRDNKRIEDELQEKGIIKEEHK